MTVAVIADIVGSRRLEDRSTAQQTFARVIAEVDQETSLAARLLRPTVGDEFQGRYENLPNALSSLLLLQLALPDGHELRFGIGVGEVRDVDAGGVELEDGPGWYAARAAIETVQARQVRAVPTIRTWIVGAPGEDGGMQTEIDMANAYLLARDALVTAMSGRERRLVYGRLRGLPQAQLADAEGISQSAVSQALTRAGASAIVAGYRALSTESA